MVRILAMLSIAALAGVTSLSAQSPPAPPRDDKIAEIIVQESRDAYQRRGIACVCPQDIAPDGRPCGERSIRGRNKDARPYCAVSEVPYEEIRRYQMRLSR